MKKIPLSTVNRLSLYLKCFSDFTGQDIEYASSEDVANCIGINAAQVRKDLAYFGQFGRRGVGYHVMSLKEQISRILGTHKEWRVGIVGVGKLGSALVMHKGFQDRGFKIVAGFDIAQDKLGWEIDEVMIYDFNDVEKVIKKEKIEIIIITTPKDALPQVMEKLKNTCIKGVLNFAGKHLMTEGDITIRNVDLGLEMEQLTYQITNK